MWLKNSLETPHKIPLNCSLETREKKKKHKKTTNQTNKQKPPLLID